MSIVVDIETSQRLQVIKQIAENVRVHRFDRESVMLADEAARVASKHADGVLERLLAMRAKAALSRALTQPNGTPPQAFSRTPHPIKRARGAER